MKGSEKHKETLYEEISRKSDRKMRARNRKEHGLLFGLGMFGLIGWSVSIPSLAGLFLGVWLDARFESRFSWTLMLLTAGVVTGCLNAWYWLQKERVV